ncbi:LacI family DNA-binding transcriptional regulator [Myceligenerans salitolerans]|uniref:LacI family DNA-binding transcriptional regulator n=1 Tax=Myceligenerans salitolerans TaxID=1230528 RepID=A0ABS3IAB9_9MICO|nr:LacI family DNA-binding transcriptional regulator [Myceligenerans salitolerans]MBO0609314.1 LacI family DNA-binding transcriptional regulator [Myceligenerans salitolerans]
MANSTKASNAANARTPRRRASITDVAKAAGVAVGTVSNVLNKPERVLPATRERVEAAIAELNFVRNGSARQLRAGTLTSVGVVVLDLANPFFTDAARGIQDRLERDSFTLMVAGSDEDLDRERRYLRLYEEHGVQGVIVSPATDDIDHVLAVRERGTAAVLLDRPSPVPELASVAVDDVAGGRLAVEHLIAQGHERIALLNGPHTIRQCRDRRDGAAAAMADAGLDPGTALVEITVPGLTPDGGEAGIREVVALPARTRPTAVFCVNDLVALGVLRTLRREGVAVPQGMAVVGYDDVTFAAELATPLSSVRQPTSELGTRAADLLFRPEDSAPEQVVFSPELVVRESSASSPEAGRPR